jgi:hypothetical protein
MTEPLTCPACGAVVPGGASGCPACRAVGERQDRNERFFLIIVCAFGLGALGLPQLLRSRAFSRRGKALLGTIAVAQTLAVVGVIVLLVVERNAIYDAWWAWAKRLHGMR